MKCRFLEQWDCQYAIQIDTEFPDLDDCKFCKDIRLMYISQYKPLVEDYAKNIGELNELRAWRKRMEDMPK